MWTWDEQRKGKAMEYYERIDDTMKNREIAKKRVRDALAKGDKLAGMLADLENIASPFFLGTDADPDDSDIDVLP